MTGANFLIIILPFHEMRGIFQTTPSPPPISMRYERMMKKQWNKTIFFFLLQLRMEFLLPFSYHVQHQAPSISSFTFHMVRYENLKYCFCFPHFSEQSKFESQLFHSLHTFHMLKMFILIVVWINGLRIDAYFDKRVRRFHSILFYFPQLFHYYYQLNWLLIS